MSNIVAQISSVILAGTNLEDEQMFDGIRNLANMTVPSYPKARLLQIILDPRIIANEASVFVKYAELKFGEIRKQLIYDLGRSLNYKEVVMMLMSFVNQLPDNNETISINGNGAIEKISNGYKNSKIKLLYKKCQDLGLQYGFLNLFPASVLIKMTKSRHKIIDQIIKRVNDKYEFKDIIQLLSSNYERGVNIVKVVSAISQSQEGSFKYVMSLPEPVIEILLDYTNLTSRKLTHERIGDLLEIYDKKQDIFASVKKKPLLAKLFMLHDDCEVIKNFLDVIAANNRKIASIHSFNSSLSSFLFSYISGKAQSEDAIALMELAKEDIKRCKLIITNMPIIRNLALDIAFLSNLASKYSGLFDLIFDKRSDNLDTIYHIKKSKKVSAEKVINDIISMGSLEKIEKFFYNMNKKYD
jgi:hypothetical protein